MDLKEIHKKKIAELILHVFRGAWSVIIFDELAGEVLTKLFKKSDLLDFRITWSFSIKDKRPNWKLPTIYFVNCTKEVAEQINLDFESNNEIPIHVFSLCKPVGLNKLINNTVVNLNFEAKEERIFKCDVSNLIAVSTVLEGRFNVNYFSCTEKLARQIDTQLNEKMDEHFKVKNTKKITLLVLDRTVDMFTPLMYFFTVRSLIKEMDNLDCKDDYYPKIRNKHLGELNEFLNKTVKKLQETIKKLGSTSVDALDTLVLDAPKNIELKENVEKYLKYFNKIVSKFDSLKDIATTQQDLVIGKDMEGNKIQVNLETFMEKILSPKLSFEDSLGLLYLLKTKGIILSKYEKDLLKSKGFAKEDLDLIFNQRNQVQRTKQRETEFKISRYEPMLLEIVENYLNKKSGFTPLEREQEPLQSLRRSTMLTVPRETQSIVVVYVKNGLCEEELKLPYLLSDMCGVECIFGSDKILSRSEFIKEYKNNRDLHEEVNRNL